MQGRSEPATDVFISVDISKGRHYVCAMSDREEPLSARPSLVVRCIRPGGDSGHFNHRSSHGGMFYTTPDLGLYIG